jgi:hypothetical protein
MPKFRATPPFPLAAWKLGLATSDRIRIGDIAIVRNMASLSFATLIYPTTFTSLRRIFLKAENDTNPGWICTLNGTSGEVELSWADSPTGLQYITNSGALKLNRWQWLCVTLNPTATPQCHIYVQDLGPGGRPFAECTYSTATDSSGSPTSDSGELLTIGNDGDATTRAFQGSISLVALFKNSTLSPNQFQQFFRNPRGFHRPNPVGLWRVGWRGLCLDESGNNLHGVITGGIQSEVWPRWKLRNIAFVSSIPSITVDLTGQTLALAQGSLVTNFDFAYNISGQTLTLTQGTPATNFDFAHSITGQTLALAQGTVTTNFDFAHNLTGQVLALAQGSIVARSDVSPALTGLALALAQGIVDVNTGAVTVNLTGQALLLNQSPNVNTSLQHGIAGQALGLNLGIVAPVTGVTTLVDIGTQLLSLTRGTIATTQLTLHNPSGQVLTLAQGTPVFRIDLSPSLAGQILSLAQGVLTTQTPNTFEPTGLQLLLNLAPNVNTSLTHGIVGQTFGFSQGAIAFGEATSINLTGQVLTLTQGTVVITGIFLTPTGQTLVLTLPVTISTDIREEIDGLALVLAQGTVTIQAPTTSGNPIGLPLTLNRGTPSLTIVSSVSITTSARTLTQGSILAQIDIDIVDEIDILELVLALGTPSIALTADIDLPSVVLNMQQGVLLIETTQATAPIPGRALTLAQGSISVPNNADPTGMSLSLAQGVVIVTGIQNTFDATKFLLSLGIGEICVAAFDLADSGTGSFVEETVGAVAYAGESSVSPTYDTEHCD